MVMSQSRRLDVSPRVGFPAVRRGWLGVALIMGNPERNGQDLSACQQYRSLLAVSEAIVSHRDLATLFHDLAGRLHLVVRFDYLACVLHDATSNTMRLHVLETTEPIPGPAPPPFSLE